MNTADILERLRLAETEYCRQRSLEGSLLGEAADKIEQLTKALREKELHESDLAQVRRNSRTFVKNWDIVDRKPPRADVSLPDEEVVFRCKFCDWQVIYGESIYYPRACCAAGLAFDLKKGLTPDGKGKWKDDLLCAETDDFLPEGTMCQLARGHDGEHFVDLGAVQFRF
jgi:hypothetical protein